MTSFQPPPVTLRSRGLHRLVNGAPTNRPYGRLLSIAHSARRTTEACELGIETRPEAHRQGYALASTILWTHEMLREGLVPIYSALAENTASLALAEAAGYRIFARGINIANFP